MGKLYIVPTPVGNLEDITFRAIRVLKDADLILAEDTRTSSFLLKHFQIENKLASFHKFNEHKSLNAFIERLKGGDTIALISDAGTPSISDPGFLIVRECVNNDIDIECLPGATAFVPALVVSGLPSDRFIFEGFLPQKKGRQKRWLELSSEERTVILYESPFRLIKALEEIVQFLGADRRISVSREISKIYEETTRGTAAEVLAYYKTKTVKGEIVVVIGGKI